MKCNNILEAVGRTPLVRLNRINQGLRPQIYVKAEFTNPRSYYSVAKKLAREIPNSYYPNQYDNAMNPEAHYRTTGPEIWEDSEGKITHFVCGVGTGGTISGVGKFLKEKNPSVKIIGVDPYGSLYYDF